MRIVLFGIMLIASIVVRAQEATPSFEQLKEYYQYASVDERVKMDSIFQTLENNLKRQQVKNIGGISFGISREEAMELLKNKYGEPVYNPGSTVISFRNIKYAGYDFDSVHFLFQSDGTNSFFNSCIFIKEAKTQKKAVEEQENLYKVLCDKYELSKAETENGLNTYGGGISPLWDGHWYSLIDEYYTALHTDIIQYESDLVEIYGNKYAARLIYGPYNYIKEEF